jgi:pimeloyl-ACP methyl ester carboxylesterase
MTALYRAGRQSYALSDASSDGVHVAYGLYGDGPVDVLLLNPTFVPVDAYLEEPHLAAAVAGLAAGRRVIAPDRRGLGLSDPVSPSAPPTLTHWVRDAVAVLDTARASRVHVFANGNTGLVALQLAATHPDRIATVTLLNSYARLTATQDYPFGEPPTVGDVLREIRTPGTRSTLPRRASARRPPRRTPRFRRAMVPRRRRVGAGELRGVHSLIPTQAFGPGADVRRERPCG